jgi:cysteine desulfurase
MKEMKKWNKKGPLNPSSIHRSGVEAKKVLEQGRTMTASFLGAHADEIIFTSGGTEANGLALEGALRTAHRNGYVKPHLIISAVEHSSIISLVQMLEKQGVEVTRLPVDEKGMISISDLKKSLKPETCMVSIMMVNNEIGTVEDIREIAKTIRHFRKNGSVYPLFHTDACQAAPYYDLNVQKLGVDLLTLDGNKIYGPRGMGMLYVKRGTPIEPTIYGGGQERGMRAGTENIPGVMGFAKALELAAKLREKESTRLLELKKYFASELQKINPEIKTNGDLQNEAPHILNVSIPDIDSEFFVLQLDAKGIECSTKSACLRDEDESYVLKAIGADSKKSVRFSFGRRTSKGELKKVIVIIKKILRK